MKRITAIISMLHEPVDRHSALCQFRGEPVLTWTLRRLSGASTLTNTALLCWDDQADSVRKAIDWAPVQLCARGPRTYLPSLETVCAARRWADGWRGGLMGTCEFDRGFHGAFVYEVLQQQDADAVLLIDPAAGLVDPALIDGLVSHAKSNPEMDLVFSQAAPGLSGVLIRPSFLRPLAEKKGHPGLLLCYHPEQARHDPIADPACAPVAKPLARTTHRFTLDSRRQIAKWSAATAHLNGQLPSQRAEELLAALESSEHIDELPREIVLELNTHRATDAIFWPGRRLAIERPPLTIQIAKRVIDELAAFDDARLFLGGVGDPLLHDELPAIIDLAHQAGIRAIAMETDLFGAAAERIAELAASSSDIVSVRLPAASVATYQAIMGIDGLNQVMANIKLFLEKRAIHGRGLPLLAPTFIKCRQNQAEMETWYDQWLTALNCAVISGPSDYGGLIPDVSVVDMSGPRRRPCVSLSKRLTVLSDGTIVSCEQDVMGRQPLGADLKTAWANSRAMARNWNDYEVCAKCRQWYRH